MFKEKGSTFKTIGGKLSFSFSITTIIILLLIAAVFWFNYTNGKLQSLSELLNQITINIEQAGNIEKQFYLEETINDLFYETGKSPLVEEHKQVLADIQEDLRLLKNKEEIQGMELEDDLQSLMADIEHFESAFDTLVQLILKRGFKDYGIEGDMRRAMGRVTGSGHSLNMVEALSIRRREKDYILRKDDKYVDMLLVHVRELRKDINRIKNPTGRRQVLSDLDEYQTLFLELVDAERGIGIRKGEGLREKLETLSKGIEIRADLIDRKVSNMATSFRNNIEIGIVVLFSLFLLTNFLLSYFTTKSLSEPIQGLSEGIKQVIGSNFTQKPDFEYSERRDEIGQLSQDFYHVVSKMQNYTAEIVQQKEYLSSAYKDIQLLGKLGQQITANIEIDGIIKVVKLNLKKLMDVPVFWIGIYDKSSASLMYEGGLLGENDSASFRQSLSETDKLGVWCFNSQQEVIINDLDQDAVLYKQFGSAMGENTKSIIYLPLTTKNKQLGVLSIQHKEKNFFNDLRIDLIRNLANYTLVALDNALIYQEQEATIEERTAKVLEQKEEIEVQKEKLEKSFNNIQLLSEMGKKLTASLSVENIIEQSYKYIDQLMDAQVFGIGIFDEEQQKLVFKASIENGQKLSEYSYAVDETDSFSVWCFNNRQEIFINNPEQDLEKYNLQLGKHLVTQEGVPQSIIYLPLQSKNEIIGVIGVQSMRKNAYNTTHLFFLRNLAIYAIIALENAQSYQQIELQKDQVQKSSEKVTASINYAKRIQEAFLPELSTIREALPNSFVFFQPRDIVSGDFYWFTKREDKIFLSALDCTGHGVPGAFMSMIGNELLNEAVNRIGLKQPNEILAHMHTGIRRDLRQYETENRDGMDMSLCMIDLENKQMEFAGANNPLVYFQENELVLLKGDKYSIGGEQREIKRVYTNHTIDISKPTTFYLFSDGYQDQFGGKDGRKFMTKKFRQLLHVIHELPIAEQKAILEKSLQKWMGKQHRQIDDVLVMGVQV